MATGFEEEDGESIDRISMIPDDILGCILSHLSLKEATATSILSRCWRYSWMFTRKLDFNGLQTLFRVWKVKNYRNKWRSELDKERVNYMRWVNNVIALCNDICIEEFKVLFNLDRSHRTCIDEWVRFALSKNVETLELILTTAGNGNPRRRDKCYIFPCEILVQYELVKLRRVRMDDVNVSGEAIELFLQKCPMLEELYISGSRDLVVLKITGPYPCLKRLEIQCCFNIQSVEIRDVDLVYLQYIGVKADFVLENLPRLVSLDIGGMITESLGDVLAIFSSYLPQLEVFTIDRFAPLTLEDTQLFYSKVKMSNLKQLRVAIFPAIEGDGASLLPLTHLLRSSPCLESFSLRTNRSPEFTSCVTKLEKASGSYPKLKEVRFLNYNGTKWDVELIAHFLENGEAVEDIVVRTKMDLEWEWDSCSVRNGHRSNAQRKAGSRVEKQLQKLAPPPRIKFTIIDY